MDERDELFRKFVEGEFSAEGERDVLHTLAEDAELRSLLRFELRLNKAFRQEPDLSTFEVPEGFSGRVMDEIQNTRVNADLEQAGSEEWLPGWLRWLWHPQPVRWRPAYAVVLVLLLTVALSLPIYESGEQGALRQQVPVEQSVQTVSESSDEVWLRFIFIDEEASSVAVAGDFSNWEPVPLTNQELNGRQVWTGLVSMSRGEHRYMFVKDGNKWVTDPLAPMYREDGFGNKNAVIYL